jgi:hypothetical protein
MYDNGGKIGGKEAVLIGKDVVSLSLRHLFTAHPCF